eukprot:TRINITY_DN27071_c0_g1_i1.p1 TRINITY_DN27071_c0_g1~~TRINITY_DN27071_c0_g1_i1.p1  ORF type:complete len:526 (-),score=46.89 TRINITY_DN27071_c0_g1_i1:126-1703(-)
MSGSSRESTRESTGSIRMDDSSRQWSERLPVMLGPGRQKGPAFSSKQISRRTSVAHEGSPMAGPVAGPRTSHIGVGRLASDASWETVCTESGEAAAPMPLPNRHALKALILGSLLVDAVQTCLEADHDFGLLDNAFHYTVIVIWFLETCLKVYCNGLMNYMKTLTTAFELFVLSLAVLEAWVVPYVSAQWPDVLVLILYYSRLFRLVRVVCLVQELRVLISGLLQAIKQLVWVISLITLVNYVLAVIASRMVGSHCDEAYAFWDECEDMFGSIPKSMISLLELMTLDMQAVRPLMQGNPFSLLLLVLFFMVTSFGLLNILTGVVVDTVLEASADSKQKLDKQRALEKQDHLQNLRGILIEILQDYELDGNDVINLNEFLDGCRRLDVQTLLQDAGIPVFNKALARRLFHVLDPDGVGEISIGAFVERTSNLVNEGRLSPQDHTLLLMDVRVMHSHIARLEKSQALLHRKMDQVIRPAEFPDQQSNSVRTSLAPALISDQRRRCSSAPSSPRLKSCRGDCEPILGI